MVFMRLFFSKFFCPYIVFYHNNSWMLPYQFLTILLLLLPNNFLFLVALARITLNKLSIVHDGSQECGLIYIFVIADLRWTWNLYLLWLFFIFISRKFKYCSPFTSPFINRIWLSCLFKIFWILQGCWLDTN